MGSPQRSCCGNSSYHWKSFVITAVYFWKVPSRVIPFALWSMAVDRRRLRSAQGISFAKMLGCGKGATFTPSDADIHRWGMLICIEDSQLEKFDSSPLVQRWRSRSSDEFRVLMQPISSHGQWSKREPFKVVVPEQEFSSKIVAITRARITWRKNLAFWKSVPPIAHSLRQSPGLISAIGVGEAPIGLQGTFSLWDSQESLKNFAYKSPAHKEAIMATSREKWFTEDLFARFQVKEIRGDL